MKISNFKLALFLALSSLLLSGCTVPMREPRPSKFKIIEKPTVAKEIKRISIIKSGEFEYIGNAEFGEKMTSIFQKCNIAIQIITTSQLELDESSYLKKIKDFKSDSVLFVKNKGKFTLINQATTSMVVDQYFSIMLIGDSGELIWSADVTVYPEGIGTDPYFTKRSVRFAIDLSNKMKEDNTFPSCKMPEPPNRFDDERIPLKFGW